MLAIVDVANSAKSGDGSEKTKGCSHAVHENRLADSDCAGGKTTQNGESHNRLSIDDTGWPLDLITLALRIWLCCHKIVGFPGSSGNGGAKTSD